jgi:hypothetical protein
MRSTKALKAPPAYHFGLETLCPLFRHGENKWKTIFSKTHQLSGGRDLGPIAQDLASSRGDASLDLWRWQAPTAFRRICFSF